MATKARASYISLLGALFDRLQLQAAAELSKRFTELLPSSARDKSKRPPSVKIAEAADANLFTSFPRQCQFYDQTLQALLKIEADCCESIVKILLMWQPRHFVDHNNSSANSKGVTLTDSSGNGSWLNGSMRHRSRGFTFAAFQGLIEPLRQLDHGYADLTAAFVELIIGEYLRHVLFRHQGELPSALLEKLNDSFQYYTKSAASASKYVGPEAATYVRVKGETLNAWLALYGAISSRLPLEELNIMRIISPEEVLQYRMISMENVADLMPAVEFLERIAGGVNGCKKTKLRTAYLLCLERAVSSIDFKHKQWSSVSVRMAALYRRACKWSKTEGLEVAASPVSALLLLRASLPPEELLLYIAKRIKVLHNEQNLDTSLRTLLALLRGSTRELEFPMEPLQKSDQKRLPYARAPLLEYSNAAVALGMTLEALFGRNCRSQLQNSPTTLELATELLMQIAAHDAKLLLYQVHRQLDNQGSGTTHNDTAELLLIVRTLIRMADPASGFWKCAVCLSNASKSDAAQLLKALQGALTAALGHAFVVATSGPYAPTFTSQPIPCMPDIRLHPNDERGLSLSNSVMQAYQRCEARLLHAERPPSKTAEVVELLREKSTAMCLPLSSVHVQAPNLEESVKRSIRSSVSSTSVKSERRNTMGVSGKRPKGEKQAMAELVRESFRALPILGAAHLFGDPVVQFLFSPDDEIAAACATSLQSVMLNNPTDRAPILRRLTNFIRRVNAEQEPQLLQSSLSHLLCLVDLCLIAPFADAKAASRLRRKASLFETKSATSDSTIGAELEALALVCLCNPLSAVRSDALALLEIAGQVFPANAQQPSISSLLSSPHLSLATHALSSLLAEAWPANNQPLPELRSCWLTVADLANSDAPLLWLHVLRRLASLVVESRAHATVRSMLFEYAQTVLFENDGLERPILTVFGHVLRANLSALLLALPHDSSSASSDAVGRCVCGALTALSSDSEAAILDMYSTVLSGSNPDCVQQLMHSVSSWYCTDFARLGQKRKARARQVLCAAFRRLISASSFSAALQRSREPLPFLISFAHDTEIMRPVTWEGIAQLCELSALIAALAGAYSTPLCVLPGGSLRVLLKPCVINDKTWPAEQRCRLLRALHSSANALQDSAVVNSLVEKAEAQRRELKESKVKAAARRQVDAALVRVQMNVWHAAEALMRLGPLGAAKAEEICDEGFLNWCLAGERSGTPLLKWLLAHHWSQFFPRFIDRCYTPADSSPLFVRAVCDQYHTTEAAAQLSDEQQRALEAVPLSSEDFAFTKRTAEASAQLLLLMLQETSAPEPEMRRKSVCILARLGMAQFGKSDGSSATAAEIAQLMKSLAPQLESPCIPVWRAAARRVLNAVASTCSNLAASLFYETLARWSLNLTTLGRHISSARREWLVDSLLPYASALRLSSLPNYNDFLRRLLTETVVSAPLPVSSSVAALWHALAIAPDNGTPLVSFLVSCGSEARHLCEAAHELLVSLFCYAPELVAPVLVDRLTCESTLQLLSTCNGTAVQDAFVQRDGVCNILVEIALAAPLALQPLLPALVAFALPRIDSVECSAARALLARVCEILFSGATDSNRPFCDQLRSFATRLTDPKTPLDLWWSAESTLLEPPLVTADVPLPTRLYKEGPGSVAATDFLKALTSLMSKQQMNLLGSQLLGWALRYQDLCLSLRTLELFLVVLRPLDVASIDSHVCSLLETLTELERLPVPSASRRPTDLQFSQRRVKVLMLLRALMAAVEETASADVLQKLFWCAIALLDVPSLPFLPLLDGVLPLLNAVLRHPMWPAAEHQACVALAQRGADFEGLLWPLLRGLCAIRTEQASFTLLCTALELELKSELLLRPSSSSSALVAAVAALPWLSLRSSVSSSASSSPLPSSLIAAFGRALAPHKHAAELSRYLSSGEAKPDSLFKGAMSVLPLSAHLLDEVTPLLLRLSSYAPPRLQAAVSRFCRSLLSNGRSSALFLDASQHLLRAAVVQASPVSFDSLLPVFARALKAATKERPSNDNAHSDSSHPPPALRLPLPLGEQPPSQRPSLCARIMRLVEATPALSAQANAHKQLTIRQRNAARSVLGADEERALVELQRLAANADSLSDPPSDLKDLQDMLGTNENISATSSARSIPPSPPTARLFDVFGSPDKSEAGDSKDETKEQEREEEADPEDLEREERDAELDRLIAAAEKFRGFDLAALAQATASLHALNA